MSSNLEFGVGEISSIVYLFVPAPWREQIIVAPAPMKMFFSFLFVSDFRKNPSPNANQIFSSSVFLLYLFKSLFSLVVGVGGYSVLVFILYFFCSSFVFLLYFFCISFVFLLYFLPVFFKVSPLINF